MIFTPQTPKIVCKRGALLTYVVVRRRSEGQRHSGKSIRPFEVVPLVGVVRFKGFSQHSERTFKKLSTSFLSKGF